jgi:hypothetical protein
MTRVCTPPILLIEVPTFSDQVAFDDFDTQLPKVLDWPSGSPHRRTYTLEALIFGNNGHFVGLLSLKQANWDRLSQDGWYYFDGVKVDKGTGLTWRKPSLKIRGKYKVVALLYSRNTA